METQEAICDFLVREIATDRDSLSPDENLLSQGVIDSMGIVKLVAFLESSFRIQVKDTEVVPEHFESIRALCEFVEKKQRDA